MKATETTLLKFIGGLDKSFIIPPFQRNYTWGEAQCKELYDDIIQSCDSGKAHYLGNLIYYEGKRSGASFTEIILVDGQQRVTTILILLCAIRDLIEDSSMKEKINRRYLINDSNEDMYRIRLKQTAYDSGSFTSIIDKEPPENSDNNVAKNYNLFIKLIKESEIDPVLIYEAIPKLEVVEINLQASDELESVQKVFEKINSTGKPLTPADLIRNLLLLTNSASDQEKLYTKYWTKIEETLQGDNISRFARDFIIMKIFNDVPEKQIYKLFKEYFYGINARNEEILDEMNRYSKYYAWIRFENCPDKGINRCIKMLNILKTDDVYPLYLHLLFNMYDNQKNELHRIFNLLTDYMLRYRIVTPSSGGGALRSVVQELLESLISGTVDLSFEAVLFELSNSTAYTGRFPDDDDFKKSLMSNVNPSYARVLLLKIEAHETQNIPVEISEVTVEHLMPQKLSGWWKTYLGGVDEADIIHRELLNCIGNLTPVSQSYNSTMSNKPWDYKWNNLRDVQFTITSEVADKYIKWGKENILKRNLSMANRAIKIIKGPLPRTRPIRTNNTEEYSPGVYSLSDTSAPMNGSTPIAIRYDNRVIECTRWRDMLVVLSSELIRINQQQFGRVVADNSIHKATSKKNFPQKDPIFSTNAELLVEPMNIQNSSYYCEGCLSNIRARVYAKQLLGQFDCIDDFYIEII